MKMKNVHEEGKATRYNMAKKKNEENTEHTDGQAWTGTV